MANGTGVAVGNLDMRTDHLFNGVLQKSEMGTTQHHRSDPRGERIQHQNRGKLLGDGHFHTLLVEHFETLPVEALSQEELDAVVFLREEEKLPADPDVAFTGCLCIFRANNIAYAIDGMIQGAKTLLVDGNADTIRAIAQGRADALVENVDFFIRFTTNYRNVNWHVLSDPIFISYCGIGVGKGSYALRDYLNVLLFELHSDGTIGQTWEKWYGAPMTIPIEPSAWF